ncbi:hypothetical protein GN956_G2264 [Arapaima gigas]
MDAVRAPKSVEMLVPVECKGVREWARVSKEGDAYGYSEFTKEILAKFRLPETTSVDMKGLSGVDVDSDVFDKLLKSSQVSFMVFTEQSSGPSQDQHRADERESSSETSFCSDNAVSSSSTVILESTKAQRRQLIDGPSDPNAARNGEREKKLFDGSTTMILKVGSGFLAWRTVQRNSAREM